MHNSAWTYVIEPLSLEDEILTYKQRLSRKAIIRDMEYLSPISYRNNDFYDGVYFRNETKDEVIYTILTGTGNNYKLWE
jgi:hypothetical protein